MAKPINRAERRRARAEMRNRIEAAYGDGAHGEMAMMISPQLCIALLKRLGGEIQMPVSELDDTGQDLMLMSIEDAGTFTFKVERKS